MVSISGRWWIPGADNRSCHGSLDLNPESEDFLILTLDGALSAGDAISGDELEATYPVLFGTSADGDKLTLVGCERAGLGTRRLAEDNSERRQERVRCKEALRNGHVADPGAPVWTSASCRFANIDEWAYRAPHTMPAANGTEDDGRLWHDVRVTLLPPIEVRVDGATLKICETYGESDGLHAFATERRHQLIWEPDDRATPKALDQDFVTPMRFFLAFATDSATPVEALALVGPVVDVVDDRVFPKPVESIRPWLGRAKKRSRHEMLLPVSALDGRVDDVLRRWLDLYSARRPALELMFAVVFAEWLFVETRFLLLAQAAEVYHRLAFPQGVLPDDEHKRRLRAVIDAAPLEQQEWLGEKLEHSNEPSLKGRLDELVEYSALAPHAVLRPKFARRVTDTRNYRTHYDPKIEKRAVKDDDLYWLSEELRALLTACLLRDLGFEDGSAWDRLRGTVLARQLLALGYSAD
jgi:hypothetical protein